MAGNGRGCRKDEAAKPPFSEFAIRNLPCAFRLPLNHWVLDQALRRVSAILFGFMSLIVFSLLCARIRSQFIEKRRTIITMGSPTQKMCMTIRMAIILKENGSFIAPESGTTTRFMKK